jgi:hypothetical protein
MLEMLVERYRRWILGGKSTALTSTCILDWQVCTDSSSTVFFIILRGNLRMGLLLWKHLCTLRMSDNTTF